MVDPTSKVSQEVLDIVRRYGLELTRAGIEVEDLFIFGSHSKGTTHTGSDIDVAVVSSNFGHDSHDERVRLMRLRRKVSTLIEPHPFHPDEFNNRWSTLAQEVKKYGVRPKG